MFFGVFLHHLFRFFRFFRFCACAFETKPSNCALRCFSASSSTISSASSASSAFALVLLRLRFSAIQGTCGMPKRPLISGSLGNEPGSFRSVRGNIWHVLPRAQDRSKGRTARGDRGQLVGGGSCRHNLAFSSIDSKSHPVSKGDIDFSHKQR